MATCRRKVEVLVVLLLTLVPRPGPLKPTFIHVYVCIKGSCDGSCNSLTVFYVVEDSDSFRWMPVLEKYGVTLPLECPLHNARDVFARQEEAKVHVPPQWTCGFCGKAFYHEAHLDRHLDNRHEEHLNNGEDAVCLADFCDVMRCEVLLERLRDFEDTPPAATALDLWHQPLLLSSPSLHQGQTHSDQAVERALPRSLMRSSHASHPWYQWTRQPRLRDPPHPPPPSSTTPRPAPDLSRDRPDDGRRSVDDPVVVAGCDADDAECANPPEETYTSKEFPNWVILVLRKLCLWCVVHRRDGCITPTDDSGQVGGGPRELPLHPLHSWRDTCNEEHLAELRVKCQQLIQQCIGGLLLNLTLEQFKEVEAALSRAVCWYLTCERYWEAGTMEPPEFPWGLVTGLVLLLTLGVSLAYYIVWVLCEVAGGRRRVAHHSAGGAPRPAAPDLEGAPLRRHGVRERVSGLWLQRGPLYPDVSDASHAYSDYDGQSYRSRHYSEDSRLSYAPDDHAHAHGHPSSKYYITEERMFNYATTFTPNYEQRRLRRNRYNYLDDYDDYQDLGEHDKYYDTSSLSQEQSDSFIYVSYPPEVKKRFTENR
ncbi:uncharacterized protein LOC119591782 [Penaeus monodon]|uniref:uncharacterized protein LOC119591782 n=1 Tax=Penaeus monodon TaxID=6687 RepID=UPI0018A71619|nr:uncharacterized protein LOC119591782 [Penaeus monodon]